MAVTKHSLGNITYILQTNSGHTYIVKAYLDVATFLPVIYVDSAHGRTVRALAGN